VDFLPHVHHGRKPTARRACRHVKAVASCRCPCALKRSRVVWGPDYWQRQDLIIRALLFRVPQQTAWRHGITGSQHPLLPLGRVIGEVLARATVGQSANLLSRTPVPRAPLSRDVAVLIGDRFARHGLLAEDFEPKDVRGALNAMNDRLRCARGERDEPSA